MRRPQDCFYVAFSEGAKCEVFLVDPQALEQWEERLRRVYPWGSAPAHLSDWFCGFARKARLSRYDTALVSFRGLGEPGLGVARLFLMPKAYHPSKCPALLAELEKSGLRIEPVGFVDAEELRGDASFVQIGQLAQAALEKAELSRAALPGGGQGRKPI